MTERTAADDFIFTALSASPDLTALLPGGINPEQATDGTDAAIAPYIVFTPLPAPDTTTNGRERCAANIAYMVRAVFEGNGPAADVAEELIETLLHNKHVIQHGWRIDCVRTAPLVNLSTPAGRTYRFAGGRYEVTVRLASLYS